MLSFSKAISLDNFFKLITNFSTRPVMKIYSCSVIAVIFDMIFMHMPSIAGARLKIYTFFLYNTFYYLLLKRLYCAELY